MYCQFMDNWSPLVLFGFSEKVVEGIAAECVSGGAAATSRIWCALCQQSYHRCLPPVPWTSICALNPELLRWTVVSPMSPSSEPSTPPTTRVKQERCRSRCPCERSLRRIERPRSCMELGRDRKKRGRGAQVAVPSPLEAR